MSFLSAKQRRGRFFAKYAARKVPPTANRVPRWQQDLQGNCNPYYDRDDDDTTAED
ncbi:hypothetical protein EYZ11_011326 [Aspergillus tanneri]|uniref:Uncharacterized protein n=1 Tax=Aspergillus tanneri TaxID=1220188 RepID=A0A4S3J3F8_9EURO|nr:hypothetical protein EYZ11_011326 [Aspergillus tanneri]